jgi:hypothetical protein
MQLLPGLPFCIFVNYYPTPSLLMHIKGTLAVNTPWLNIPIPEKEFFLFLGSVY